MFGLRTVYDRYLLRHPETRLVIETPQYAFLRVACGLSHDADEAAELYGLLSRLEYMTASPTLFNSGTTHPQMSSCYLLDSPNDSLEGIYDTYKNIAKLSKFAGGIGVPWSRIRSRGSLIHGTNGMSKGVVPWLKTLDSSVAAVDQGGSRRGAACVYLEPWHADVEEFLELRDNTGDEARRAHQINLANWIPDLFMRRVEADETWSLFDPNKVPQLVDTYGAEFERVYLAAETEGIFERQIPSRDLYARMMRTLAQTGNGWMCFKDPSNTRCNQTGQPGKVVHSSNLCVAPETLLLTSEGHLPISKLADQQVQVWNGREWSEVTVRKTGVDQPLVTVSFSNGATFDCTPYHRFYIQQGYPSWGGEVVVKRASELREGDWIAGYDLPAADGAGQPQTIHAPKVHVVSVVDHGRRDDTYCFTEPLRHAGVFNGVLAGNCTEIEQVTDAGHTAVCNLGSVNLKALVGPGGFDFDRLGEVVRTAVRYLDRVIDINFYPVEAAKRSNERWRPVGLGLMGLADVYYTLRLPFDSPEARELSRRISEDIYFHALWASTELAEAHGPHPGFDTTRAAAGQLQFDLWGVQPSDPQRWVPLRERIAAFGLRNSLLIAIAPTATIASISGCSECAEPPVSNLFKRETLSGEFLQINSYLVRDLQARGLWGRETIDAIKRDEGSIRKIPWIPDDLKALYRTAWELPMRSLIDMAADRGAFIDQSQSLNLFAESPNIGKLSSMYMHAWKRGLKSTYYLRSRPATRIAKTTVEGAPAAAGFTPAEAVACSLENPGVCHACE